MSSKSLIQNRKTLARVVLYGSPIFVFLALTLLIRNPPDLAINRDWEDIDYLEFEAVRIFQEYLRIDTSYPDGSEIAGAEYLASVLEAEGVDVYVERLGERNANMWAELPGKKSKALVMHHHLDVIPARAEDWNFAPFGGEIEAPFIYGRGAFDMKSVAVAQLMVMLELARSGETLDRPLLFLGTGEEERDSWLGTQRLLVHHPELRSRMWAVLTEGGAVEAVNLEEARYWGTSFHQKRYIDIWVCDGDRDRLSFLRGELHKKRTPRRMHRALEEFFLRYGPSRDRPETRALLADPGTMLDRIRTFPRDVDVTVVTPNIELMLRSSVVVFPIEKDPEGGHQMRIILHLQSDLELVDVWDPLIGDALDGFTYRIEEVDRPNNGSPLDHELFQHIDRFMARERPHIDHGPLSIPLSASDSRFFRSYGIPSYGFSPFHIISSDTSGMKGANERMALPAFVDGVQLYGDMIRELVTKNGP